MIGFFRYSFIFIASLALPAVAYSADVVRIGYQKSATTLVLLKEEGSLENRLRSQGVKVEWTQFPGGPQLLEGLNIGAIDFGFTGETPPVFAQAANANLVYVANEPASPTAEAILVLKDSPLNSVAQLKGKKVALNKGSNVHYLLVRALYEAGLQYSDITPVYLPPADARAAFENGSVDAWVIWDPFSAAAEKQIHARVLRDGRGIVDNYQFYLARRDFADKHPHIITALIEEVRLIGKKAVDSPEEVARQIAPLLGLPANIAQLAVERQGYDAQFISPEAIASQQRIADTFVGLKLIPKKLDIKQAVWIPPQ
ncbi:sulfonate ABC transporter substrate-binding protein [Pectobacterium wasabiae]|uniref:Putative aliphatic sulfonates-binding protein n=1 Tax=Pectobacterium wasabiae TaxID=55208 RepID=A0AAW3ELT6_9GAMM|nr:sulfonate ABC transporter substrate-binding protein [Pectobacterium wasabiae]AOR64207.1 ABC transporter substrate-binding protein [Pectobacterium wasabiae CFBP 3304]EJS92682.1 Aliphatic sulfonates family protein ABC transporter [Pectobacterium wasabiae CFBP 3304]KFX09308.1 ABC transporter substrate-binding protein [Pectobacterium wasabiae]KGA29415.1 ABC transporter substrate-binding protein [Pectobacterium wasabiae]